mmetsp:Transcript_28395/g.71314  ORF Transcript_28395/g.71314 Transcript_28395/m.71314 type:complete len:137 (-) Transcript_28395:1032-1442(-)
MFFDVTLEKQLYIHPRYFGPKIRMTLYAKLHSEVEGTCSGRHGFIIKVISVEDIGKGVIQDSTGFVRFSVRYKAIVFRPFKGEVVDAVVESVNPEGFFCVAGPLRMFVSKYSIPSEMFFDPQSNPPEGGLLNVTRK